MSRGPWVLSLSLDTPGSPLQLEGMRGAKGNRLYLLYYNQKCNGFSAPESLKFVLLFYLKR